MSTEISAFISFSGADATDIAAKLRSELIANGVNTGNATPAGSYGDSEGLDQAVAQCSHLLVVVTPGIYRTDSSVRLEIAAALGQNKPIVPLIFNDSTPPLTIVHVPRIEFSDWPAGITRLLGRLKRDEKPASGGRSERTSELAYLQEVGRQYDHWRDLYTELRVAAHGEGKRVRVRTASAVRYLGMQHEVYRDISYEPDSELSKSVIVNTFDELRGEVLRYGRVALVGDPGAGKTTTLERLAYSLAARAADDEQAPLPLFARLGAFKGGEFSLFLESCFGGLALYGRLPARVFVLLDGLNELAHEYLSDVQTWLMRYPTTPVVVTCRKLDYLSMKLPLQRIDVQPLDVTRIFNFIGRYLGDVDQVRLFWQLSGDDTRSCWTWYCAEYVDESSFEDFWHGDIGPTNNWDTERLNLKRLQDELRLHGTLPGMLGVVRNPFLLFVVIQIYIQHGIHPRNRAQLFDHFVALLIERRGRPGAVTRPPWVDERVQRSALVSLAYEIQAAQGGTSVDRDWALAVIQKAEPEHDANQIAYLAASAGIVEGGRSLRFSHQLLQEYFAAHRMDEKMQMGVPATEYWPSERWWEPTGWEETAILLAGLRSTPGATDVLNWLVAVNPIVAFRCVRESGSTFDADAVRPLYQPQSNARISPEAVAEWGRSLATEGDSRPGVGRRGDGLPDLRWCLVPAGRFQMGGDLDVAVEYSRWPGAEIDLPYDFWLSKYLVTYSQFEAFVEDEGYLNDVYWSRKGLEWRGNQTSPSYWGDERWHISNHPVVGITWYEAMAFASWLNVKMADLKPSSDAVIRLPTEAEWEKAARYPDGRWFPWGDQYAPGCANVDETNPRKPVGPGNLRRTSAVGVFPHGASHLGIHDLSGNVWEWGLSQWTDDYEFPELNDVEGSGLRMLRGGSWFYDDDFARSASRSRDHPGNRDYDVGFRLCAASPMTRYRPYSWLRNDRVRRLLTKWELGKSKPPRSSGGDKLGFGPPA